MCGFCTPSFLDACCRVVHLNGPSRRPAFQKEHFGRWKLCLQVPRSGVKGVRERTVSSSPAGTIVTLRQCDLKRTVTLNEQSHPIWLPNDPQDDSAAQAAALLTGAPTPTANSGGTITQTATVIDTGERKQVSGYTTRHLKTIVVVESSPNACSHLSQKYELTVGMPTSQKSSSVVHNLCCR